MHDIPKFLERIGSDGRIALLEKWLSGQSTLVANYNKGPRDIPKYTFINYIVNGLYSGYNRQVKDHLAIIDAPVLEQFEIRYAELLASVN